jgi:hypothetical protein
MKNPFFRDIKPCNEFSVDPCFVGGYRLHFHFDRIREERRRYVCHLLSRWILATSSVLKAICF